MKRYDHMCMHITVHNCSKQCTQNSSDNHHHLAVLFLDGRQTKRDKNQKLTASRPEMPMTTCMHRCKQAHTCVHTEGQTTQKLNAFSPIYKTGRSIREKTAAKPCPH